MAEYYVTSNMFLNQQRNVIWMVLRNYSFFGIDLGNDYRLKDYISQLKVKHYISSDQKTIYGLDVPTNKLICKYILDLTFRT